VGRKNLRLLTVYLWSLPAVLSALAAYGNETAPNADEAMRKLTDCVDTEANTGQYFVMNRVFAPSIRQTVDRFDPEESTSGVLSACEREYDAAVSACLQTNAKNCRAPIAREMQDRVTELFDRAMKRNTGK
jgi:hypothetical protein